TMYENDKNAFPTNPADLYPTYLNDIRVFQSPGHVDEDVSYTLVTGVTSENARDVLAFENPAKGTATPMRNVLYTSGMVVMVQEDEFQRDLKETESNVKRAGKKFGTVPMSMKEISKKTRKE